MSVEWILQKDIFQEESGPLQEEIVKQGNTLTLIDLHDQVVALYGDPPHPQVFRGSIVKANEIRRHTNWIPGAFKPITVFNCNEYYPFYRNYLLNDDYFLLPFGELRNRGWGDLPFNDSYLSGIFVRPNSSAKLFTGFVITPENREKEITYLENRFVSPADIILIAPEQKIHAEYRFVISGLPSREKIIAQTQYLPEESTNVPQECRDFVNKILLEVDYSPDIIYCMDIGLTDFGYKIIEMNSFSSSGLYKCDPEQIVREVSLLSYMEWESYK